MVLSRYDKISCTCNKNKWCRHDRISLSRLEQESFYAFSQFLRIGFSMWYKTSIFFITVGLVSHFVSAMEVRQKLIHQQRVWVFIIFNLGIKRNAKILKEIKGFSIKHELSVTHHHVSFSNTQIKHELSIPHHHVS